MMSDQDAVYNKTTADYHSLNGYKMLMQCVTNSKKHKRPNKSRSYHLATANKTNNKTSAIRKNYKCFSRYYCSN